MLNIVFVVSIILAVIVLMILIADMANGHMYLSDITQRRLGLIYVLLLGVAIFCHLKGR